MRPHSFAPRLALVLTLGFAMSSCNGGSNDAGGGDTGPLPPNPTDSLNAVDLDSDGDGDLVVDVPGAADPRIRALFTRYSALVAPSGGRVHILAQSGVSNAKIRRVREALSQHLTPVPGTAHGATKLDVFESLPQQRATLALFRDASAANPARPANAAFLAALGESVLPLRGDRIVTEGSAGYLAAMPAEDNTFGVTAALVHRLGLRQVRAAYADELATLAADALASGRLIAPANAPASALVDAFLAVVMDVHSGVFGHGPRPDGRGGSEYLYAFDTRAELEASDPTLAAWMHGFFAQDHHFLARIEPDFAGTFDCLQSSTRPYSARSQYLRNVVLTGANPSELFGSTGHDVLRGNVANNNLKGRAGDDLLVGGEGFDTAVFSGPLANYTVLFENGKWVVEDVHGGHDGRDFLDGIERLEFTDQGVNL